MTGGPRRLWSLASPHGQVVAVAVPADDEAADDLEPDEREALAALAAARRPEWLAGRRALRAALVDVAGDDAAAAALGIDDRGAPVLPARLVGSISHKRALAVALAAADDGGRVGVDVEALAPRRHDLSPRVLTARERDALAATGAARERAVLRAFALKEAIYKAIDPFLRRHVGFLEVEVWPDRPAVDDQRGLAAVSGDPSWGLAIDAAWRVVGDHVVCTARAVRR